MPAHGSAHTHLHAHIYGAASQGGCLQSHKAKTVVSHTGLQPNCSNNRSTRLNPFLCCMYCTLFTTTPCPPKEHGGGKRLS